MFVLWCIAFFYVSNSMLIQWRNKICIVLGAFCRWMSCRPAESNVAKIAWTITHVGGSTLTSPPHPMEFDKMERKGGQRRRRGVERGVGGVWWWGGEIFKQEREGRSATRK